MTPAPGRPAQAPSWLLAGAPSALALVAAGLALRDPDPVVLLDGHVLGDTAMAVVAGVVAALLLGRLPGHPVGRCFAVVAWSGALAASTGPLHGVLPAPWSTVVAWVGTWAWLPGIVVTAAVLPAVFPDGARNPWERRLVWAGVLATVVATVALALGPRLETGADSDVANPWSVPGAEPVGAVASAALVPIAVCGVGVLLGRLRGAGQARRQQVAPFLLAGVVVLAVVLVAPRFGRAGAVLQAVAVLAVPATALLCVLRWKLYDLEVVVRRATVWTALSLCVVLGYIGVVQLVSRLVEPADGAASVVATAAVALAVVPLRDALQRLVGRALYGVRGDPRRAVVRTSALLAGSSDPLGALRRAVADLETGLRVPTVRVLREGVVLAGSPDGPAGIVVPLRTGEEAVGVLEVVARTPGERFTRGDRRLFDDLAAPLAQAVAAVGLVEDLRSSRDLLVRAREEERRRLRADLHDGLGPTLAALVLQSRTAGRRLSRDDRVAAQEVLGLLEQTAGTAVADLRAVVDGLRPPALDDVGLAAAVAGLTDSFASEELCVALTLDLPEEALPAAVEVAALRAVAESLANTSRHASASRVEVDVRVHAGVLAVSVRDDGTGPGTGRRPEGAGLPSMRARAEELGGQLHVRPMTAAGLGTWVLAEFPLTDRAAGARL